MTTAITIPYSDRIEFSTFVTQLRALGAIFYVKAQESFRILEFKTLPPQATQLIEAYQVNTMIEAVTEVSINAVEAVEEVPNTIVEETITYFTAQEVKNLTKKEIEALAKVNNIDIPTNCKTKAKMVQFLDGKIKK